MKNLINMTDADICETAAKKFAKVESIGKNALLTAAIFFKLRGASAATSAAMLLAMTQASLTEGSAKNYISKARVAAEGDNFPWALDVNAPLEDNVKSIFPEFQAKWPSVNDIKRAKAPKAEKEEKGEKDAALQNNLAKVDLPAIVTGLAQLDATEIATLISACHAELKRRTDAIEEAAKAA